MGGGAHGGREEADGAPPAAVRAGSGSALSAPLGCRTLLAGAIDYAGLFPPAALTMADAVTEYASHRAAPDRWALGRFVVSLQRLAEFSAARDALAADRIPWPVSIVASVRDCNEILDKAFATPGYEFQAVELKAEAVSEVRHAVSIVGLDVFVELGAGVEDLDAFVETVASAGAAAKIRTGGTTLDMFPSAQRVLGFLHACRNAQIRFKATAGLHHAVRGEYRLTYEPSPPIGEMFGFLNVGVAASLLWHGRSDEVVLGALDERSTEAFEFTDTGLRWRGERLSVEELADARASFFVGFGSCSFREPMAEIGLEAVPRR